MSKERSIYHTLTCAHHLSNLFFFLHCCVLSLPQFNLTSLSPLGQSFVQTILGLFEQIF